MEINNIRTPSCNIFKVASLTESILGSIEISNFKDRYILGEQLGWGQFGVIRVCSDKFSGEVLACKSIGKEKLLTPDDVRSLKLEIEIMTKLSGHPNVVELKAVYEDEKFVHLVMELCAGGELFHRLEKYGKFSEREAQSLFKHLMEVVIFCHDKGIVHRDLKPENILLATKSSSSPIKLADFGLATYIKPGQSLYGTVGSPFYIAPEVLAGGYNKAADVWSAGVILYILLSGTPPFWGKTKSKIFTAVRNADLRFSSDPWDRLSASARDLVTRMLCVDPSRRLTATEVLGHSWMKEPWPQFIEPLNQEYSNYQKETRTALISGNQGYILNNGSFVTSDNYSNREIENSPIFTCKSSFSSFLVEDDYTTPCSMKPGGFSFSSCCSESNGPDFFSPISSLPSFTFFTPTSQVEEPLAFKPKFSSLDRGVSLGKLFALADNCEELCKTEEKTEIRKGNLGIHSKRNHTIGHGELGHIVTESVIRWVSCTHIPNAPSLRSSLVC
jgi:calcium-dependent protein kinase